MLQKWSGAGNNFLIAPSGASMEEYSRFAVNTSQYHDGLLSLLSPQSHNDFKMGFWGNDGIEDFCGNGIRCLAGFAKQLGLAKKQVTIEFLDHYTAEALFESNGEITIGAGKPFSVSDPVVFEELNGIVGYPINTGTPHCVIFSPETPDDSIFSKSPIIERDQIFPETTSVIWADIRSKRRIKARIWERNGTGETLACASGACAVVWWARELGLCERRVEIQSKGGKLSIEIGMHGYLSQTGPVERLY